MFRQTHACTSTQTHRQALKPTGIHAYILINFFPANSFVFFLFSFLLFEKIKTKQNKTKQKQQQLNETKPSAGKAVS